jgi:hypothetical protein
MENPIGIHCRPMTAVPLTVNRKKAVFGHLQAGRIDPDSVGEGRQRPVKPRPRLVSAIAALVALAACSSKPLPPSSPTPKAAFVSFDGTYRGRIRVTSHTLGGPNSNWCDTPQAISLSVQNNAFRYLLAHPNLPPDPDLSPTIEVASISPDGSFNGFPVDGGPEMVGSIIGSHIEGEIHGLGCAYAFTAERVVTSGKSPTKVSPH